MFTEQSFSAHRRTSAEERRQSPSRGDIKAAGGCQQSPMKICEQAHQQTKKPGLDQFEGRSWKGLHRHALMAMIAYAFPQHERPKKAKPEKPQGACA
jgi:SRSO17 transposase